MKNSNKKTVLSIAYFILTLAALGVKIAECKIEKGEKHEKEWFEV